MIRIFLVIVAMVIYPLVGAYLQAHGIIEHPAYWTLFGAFYALTIMTIVLWNIGEEK